MLLVIPVGVLLLPEEDNPPPAEPRPEGTSEGSPAPEATPAEGSPERLRRRLPLRRVNEDGTVTTRWVVMPSGPAAAAVEPVEPVVPPAAEAPAVVKGRSPAAVPAVPAAEPLLPVPAVASPEPSGWLLLTRSEGSYGPVRALRALGPGAEAAATPSTQEPRPETLELAQRLSTVRESAVVAAEEEKKAAADIPASSPAAAPRSWGAAPSRPRELREWLDAQSHCILDELQLLQKLTLDCDSLEKLEEQLRRLRRAKSDLLQHLRQLPSNTPPESLEKVQRRYGMERLQLDLQPENWENFAKRSRLLARKTFALREAQDQIGRQYLVKEALKLGNARPLWILRAEEEYLRIDVDRLQALVNHRRRLHLGPADYPQQLEQAQQRLAELRANGFEAVLRESLQQQQFASQRLLLQLERPSPNSWPLTQRRWLELLENTRGLLQQQQQLRPLLTTFSPEEVVFWTEQLGAVDRQLLSVLQQLVPEPESLSPELELQQLARQRQMARSLPPALMNPPTPEPDPLPSVDAFTPPHREPEPLQLREARDLPPALRQSHGGQLARIPGRYMATRWGPAPVVEMAEEKKGGE